MIRRVVLTWSLLFISTVTAICQADWHDPSALLGETYEHFHAQYPRVCKRLSSVKGDHDRSACFINGHVDTFLPNANGARLVFYRDRLATIEFSIWRGNGAPDGIIVRYGPFDASGSEPSDMKSILTHDGKRYFWTKNGYKIVWEQYFRRSFSDAMVFNGDTERVLFAITDPNIPLS